jgi:hypothetical protein
MTYYLVLMMGVADRIRGDSFQPVVFNFNHRLSAYIVLGWTFAALTSHSFDVLTLPIALATTLGASSGLSEPIGSLLYTRPMVEHELEWWQFGPLKDNAILATAFRGFMWGLPIASLSYFDPTLFWALPAYTIGTLLSILFAKWFLKADWQYMEFLRGVLVASLFLIFKG